MKIFNDDSPIYLQLRRHIEELILNRILSEEDAIPSLRTMAKDYKLNPLTVSNAVGALVEEGILYKKRGIGIFVSPDSRNHIIAKRSESFITDTLEPALRSARQLEIPKLIITQRLNALYGEES
ncbi:MAG: GntR family transcriptional regulator [Candidatus Cloacimonetes bacterium HGW-Cloacimonetes-1]|jgi:DNA-binding transcriptional regulator YhcF (GntR family)|nr:MAG: GntR family transcriptional regulator [Candidatus Cloacimonetes bacterium HGW-Cloacimonetes-1]